MAMYMDIDDFLEYDEAMDDHEKIFASQVK